MPISARNKLRGKIEEIQLGDVMAHVVIRVGAILLRASSPTAALTTSNLKRVMPLPLL
jgi:molybdopterin-binding protein